MADSLGKEIIFYSTNIRKITSLSWGINLYGCGLIAPALALSQYISKVIISASHSLDIAEMCPCGSSVLFDKYISNSRIMTEHYGSHLRRIDKIKKISQKSFLLKNCRVCYQDTLEYNCGICEKCLRTMVPLLLLKIPEGAVHFHEGTYSWRSVIGRLKNLKIKGFEVKVLWAEILSAIQNNEFDIPSEKQKDVEFLLRKQLCGFYNVYKTRNNNANFLNKSLSLSFIRKVERFLCLPPDSLGIPNYYERKLRFAYYRVIDWIKRRKKK